MNKQQLIDSLKPYGQEHLIQFWDELSPQQRLSLLQQLQELDFEELEQSFNVTLSQRNSLLSAEKCDLSMEPVPQELRGSYEASSAQQLAYYQQKGLEAIAQGQCAVILLAGGQGTRLGVNYPKGMYSVNLPSGKTLYQLQAERLLRVQELASRAYGRQAQIPWYILSSEHTQSQTQEFFKSHDYFGLDASNVHFFEQGSLPCFNMQGKIILDEKHKISRAPDGNGGLYKALLKKGVLADMMQRHVKYVHIYCVDNILVKMADPIFTGFCLSKNANCASKVVKKIDPEEKVGVICKVKERYQVVEYSEINETTRNLRDENDDLVFSAGNICNHFMTLEFLNQVCNKYEHLLPYHIAEKKIDFIDEDGFRRKPSLNNGIKLEKFVFDVFQLSNAPWAKGNFLIWEVKRDEEFSALKNGDSAKSDTPSTCRNDLIQLHYRWLKQAGAEFHENNDLVSRSCEISPLVSYAGEGLVNLVQGFIKF